jgi:hypothetical protein
MITPVSHTPSSERYRGEYMVINESEEHAVTMFKVEVVLYQVPPPYTLKKEAAGSFETLLTIYRFVWCHIPEDYSLTFYLLQHSSDQCYT